MNIGKIKTCFKQMIVDVIDGKPYYSIMYFDPRDNEYHVGYGSYVFENTLGWLMESFDSTDYPGFDPLAKMKEELKIRCAEFEELKHLCDKLRDENSKLGLQYEKLLKEKSGLDRQMGYLEGQVEAYRFIWGYRKERQ